MMKIVLAFAIRCLAASCVMACGLVACGSAVDTSGLVPIDDYRTWERRVEAVGEVGGHGTSFRVMYANDIAETFGGAGLLPVGSVIVKEIYELNAGDTMGALSYLAIMRKLEEAPDGGELDRGWLFTIANDTALDETHNARCWRTCHQAAPFDGAFLDWSSATR